jgi:hypothetical protein
MDRLHANQASKPVLPAHNMVGHDQLEGRHEYDAAMLGHPSIRLLSIVSAILAVCAISACGGDSDSEQPSTDMAEAQSVGDILRRYNAASETTLRQASSCERGASRSDTYATYYDECFERNGAPIMAAAKGSVLGALDELKPDVGPACRRALRAATLAFEAEDELLPDKSLSQAQRKCTDEARS